MDAGWKGMLGHKGTIETVHANGTYTVKVSPAYTMKDVEKMISRSSPNIQPQRHRGQKLSTKDQ